MGNLWWYRVNCVPFITIPSPSLSSLLWKHVPLLSDLNWYYGGSLSHIVKVFNKVYDQNSISL